MDPEALEGALNIGMAVVGLAALIWAVVSRQFHNPEWDKFTIDDSPIDYYGRRSPSTKRRVTTGIVLGLVFLSIAGSVMMTVAVAAGRGKAASNKSPAKCPFQ